MGDDSWERKLYVEEKEKMVKRWERHRLKEKNCGSLPHHVSSNYWILFPMNRERSGRVNQLIGNKGRERKGREQKERET